MMFSMRDTERFIRNTIIFNRLFAIMSADWLSVGYIRKLYIARVKLLQCAVSVRNPIRKGVIEWRKSTVESQVYILFIATMGIATVNQNSWVTSH